MVNEFVDALPAEEQAYHAICHAIRASGHVDHLARFMIAYQATKINR